MPDVHLVDARAGAVPDRAAGAVEVLLAGWPLAEGEALADELRLRGVAGRPVSVAELPALAARGGAAVLALGPELPPAAAVDIVRDLTRDEVRAPWVLLALGAGQGMEMFQEPIDRDRLLFVAGHPPPVPETVELLVAAAKRAAPPHIDDDAAERHSAVREDAARLFRGEALEQYQRGSTNEGHLLEIEPRWMRRAYGAILALLGAALLFSVVARVDREARGVGVVRDGHLVAIVPARYRSQLRPASPLQFELSEQPLAVGSVRGKILSPPEARRLLGPDGAALWTSPEAVVTIDAALPAAGGDLSDGVAGRVRVRLGRERVLFALIPALRGLGG
jgi:hypothetical protein